MVILRTFYIDFFLEIFKKLVLIDRFMEHFNLFILTRMVTNRGLMIFFHYSGNNKYFERNNVGCLDAFVLNETIIIS